MAILEIEVAAEEQAREQREARLAGLSVSEWAKQRLFGAAPVTFTTDDGEIPDLHADRSRAGKSNKNYTSVEEQVEYGLESVDEGRRVEVSVRDLIYINNTLGEIVRFFHNRDHYPNISAVHKFIGDKEAGALHLLSECYYHKLGNILPDDIEAGYNGGALENPSAPYYHRLPSHG